MGIFCELDKGENVTVGFQCKRFVVFVFVFFCRALGAHAQCFHNHYRYLLLAENHERAKHRAGTVQHGHRPPLLLGRHRAPMDAGH